MARHGSISEQMAALLAFRNRPEVDEPIVPVKTNWQVDKADGVDDAEIADMRFERKRITTPSVDAIMREVATDDIERNAAGAKIEWRFTTEDARRKMQRLYPSTSD